MLSQAVHTLWLDSGLCTFPTASSSAHLSRILNGSLRVVAGMHLVPQPRSCLWSCAMLLCMLPDMSNR